MKNIPKEIIEGTANAIMQSFIPKDENATEFTFNFTIPPSNNFKAIYKRAIDGPWQLISCQKETSL